VGAGEESWVEGLHEGGRETGGGVGVGSTEAEGGETCKCG
jgi:hypothetical protein